MTSRIVLALLGLFGAGSVHAADRRQLACVKAELSAADRKRLEATANRWSHGLDVGSWSMSPLTRPVKAAASRCGARHHWSERATHDAAEVRLAMYRVAALRRRVQSSGLDMRAVDATFADFTKADRTAVMSDPQPSPTPIEKGLRAHGIRLDERDQRYSVVNNLLYNLVSLADAGMSFAAD